MAVRLPSGTEINNRLDGDCAGCGKHVPLFGGYVLPGVAAPRLYCVPCSVAPAPSPVPEAPRRRVTGEELAWHRCTSPRLLFAACGGYCGKVCDDCEDARKATFAPGTFAVRAKAAE